MPSGLRSVNAALVRKKSDRRNGANIKAAQVIFAAKVEALKRRRHHSAVAGQERTLHVKANRVAPLLHGFEVLVLHDRTHGPHRPAQPGNFPAQK